jgi:hypothetical protein
MPEQQTKPDQKQTCRNNQQNRTKNRHAERMNKTESTTHMPQQQTKPDQKQTRCNKLAADQNGTFCILQTGMTRKARSEF